MEIIITAPAFVEENLESKVKYCKSKLVLIRDREYVGKFSVLDIFTDNATFANK